MIQLKSEGTDSNGDDVETETPYYGFFLKNAYLQAKNDLGAATLTTQFGLIGTPVIGLADKVSDYRWIYNNFIDKSKNLLGTSIDTSADLGISVKADIMKMVSITGAYMNGEGYKGVDVLSQEQGQAKEVQRACP